MSDSETIEAPEFSEDLSGEFSGLPPTDAVGAMRVLEAMLFASAEPLTLNAMRERLPQNTDLGGMLMDLQQTYNGRGVTLVEFDNSWAFRTATDLSDALSIKRDVQRKMSRAAMETLAIIAYHQPVTRAEVENIRGIATNKGTLDVLMEAGWIKPGKRRETPGRPLTWVTTVAFLDHFGLEALTDLPGLDELKASGLLDRRPAIDTLSETGDMFGLDEGDADDDDKDDEDEDELTATDDGEAEDDAAEDAKPAGDKEGDEEADSDDEADYDDDEDDDPDDEDEEEDE